MEADKKEVQEYIRCFLNVFEAFMSLIMHEDEVGVVDMTNKAAVDYYLCVLTSPPGDEGHGPLTPIMAGWHSPPFP